MMRPIATFALFLAALTERAAAQPPRPATISGVVVDALTRVPLVGAVITATGTAVRSGTDGRFRLTALPPAPLVVTLNGYAPRTVAVAGDTAGLVVALDPATSGTSRDETARTLEGLTITAVRAGGTAPIAQTTLERADLERDYAGQDVPLTLRAAPSVTAYSESGSLLNYSYFRIRGIDQSRINITLDGVPLNEPEDQQIYFSDFPDLTSSVQSVQVQRGVGTSTYGQAAFGGSVNFATAPLSAGGTDVSLSAGAGSFGTSRATLEGTMRSAMAGRLALAARLSGMQSDGYRDGASSIANSVFASAGYLGGHDLVKLMATTGLERNGQAYTPIPLDELRSHPRANPLAGVGDKYRESMLSVAYTRLISPSTSAGATAYAFGTRGFYDYPSGAPGPALRYRSQSRWAGMVAAAHSAAGPVTLDVGAHGMSYSKEHAFDDRPDLQYPGYENTGYKSEASAFAKVSVDRGAVSVFADLQARTAEFRYRPTPGYGLADASQRWNFVNPKVGVTLRPSTELSLFASFGTTGREPTRGDLFAGSDDVTPDDAPVLLPLARVRPEHVNDLEAGARLSARQATLSLSAFDMRFRDEIARTGATTPLGYDIRANVGRSYRRGVEVELSVSPVSAFDVALAATISRSRIAAYRDEASGITYRDVDPILTPRLVVSHQLSWRATRALGLTLDGRYQGRTYLAPQGDARLTTPPFYALDVGGRLAAGRLSLHVLGRNLLDRRAYPSGDVSGGIPRYFILAPRSLDVSVRVQR